MTEPEESAPAWRVWFRSGLLEHTPMTDERREQFRKEEEERERRALEAEAEAEAARDRALEHGWELQRQGVTPQPR